MVFLLVSIQNGAPSKEDTPKCWFLFNVFPVKGLASLRCRGTAAVPDFCVPENVEEVGLFVHLLGRAAEPTRDFSSHVLFVIVYVLITTNRWREPMADAVSPPSCLRKDNATTSLQAIPAYEHGPPIEPKVFPSVSAMGLSELAVSQGLSSCTLPCQC